MAPAAAAACVPRAGCNRNRPPIPKTAFRDSSQPVRQRTLAEILLEQEGLAGIKFLQRRYNLVELGLHVASEMNISL